ncbi:MAG: UDP-2,3-diacylglucosamine diphosphatase [Gemmatimonadota bacterium]
MSQRTVVISDVHLGAIPAAGEASFLSFLRRVDRLADDLLINGDLFDFWYEYDQVVPRGHFAILSAIHELVRGGMPVRFLGGNHDGWARTFLSDEVGMEIVEGPVVLTVGGRSAYVAHGDGLGGGDWGYRALKWASHSWPGRRAFRMIHPGLGIPLARRASRTETRGSGNPEHVSPRAARLEGLARDILAERHDIDLVIFGHTHRPQLEEIRPGRFYLNAGDWIHHASYAVVTPEGIELVMDATRGS